MASTTVRTHTERRTLHIAAAETLGTFVLVLGGPGSAVLATGAFTPGSSIEVLGVSLAFGLSLLAMAYAIGNISGCHINPAVTLGLWLSGKIEAALVPVYLAASSPARARRPRDLGHRVRRARRLRPGRDELRRQRLGHLSPGGFGFGAMAVTEIVMTGLLVFVVLSTTHRRFSPAAGGLAVGLTLDADPPHQHPGRQHVGEPGPQLRHGDLRRRRRARAAVGVLRLPAPRCGRRRAGVAARRRRRERREDEVLGPTKLVDVADAVAADGGASPSKA